MVHLRIPCPNPAAPVFLFILLLCSSSLASSGQNETENDRQALLCFKSLLSDPAHALSSWINTSLQFCNWHGVTCGEQLPRRVIALDLASKSIAGTISPCIANLTSLKRLRLSSNDFHGSIPPEFGRLTELRYLNLSINSLDGVIPPALSSCTRLRVLGLWNNSLQGEIPPTISQCKDIREINLSNNKLQGRIPAAFGMFPKLQILNLASNRLFGCIPSSLGGSSLTLVDLGRNSLTGVIPESLANSSVQVLRLMSNTLTGKLPKALFNSSSLTTICLQQNHFVGSIPHVTARSPPLKYLSLKENNISGPIPQSLGNMSSLVSLGLVQNNLVGSIPENLGHIPTLEQIKLGINNLSGNMPPSLFNMTSLKLLVLGKNLLTGKLPSEIGYTLPNIQELALTSNRFDGTIPTSLVNASQLVMIYMAINMLTGPIPFFGPLPKLEILDVGGNMLEPGDWGFLSSLSNCTRLTTLKLDWNNLQGSLPVSIGNLPNDLETLWLSFNNFSGVIPSEMGNLKNLMELRMGYNCFSGSLPSTIVDLEKLVVLEIQQSNLSGQIPGSIGSLSQLNELHLEENNLTGSIPASIGQCRQLMALNLSHNALVGGIPSELLKLSSLSTYLDLSHNHFSGEIPEDIGNLINLNQLDISNNRLSSKIPSSLGQCVLLVSLEMQSNFLEGSIPHTFTNLVGLNEMDLSQNNLSGPIPGFLTSLTNLHVLNLSFNNFEGVAPDGGVFSNGGAVSIQGNDRLCAHNPALHIPLCTTLASLKRKRKSFVPKISIPVAVVTVTVISLLVWFVAILKSKNKQSVQHFKQPDSDMKRITYQDITKATDQFSPANLIGAGSFGKVYKGRLELEDNIVAIKIFNLDIFGANESFIAECGTLKAIRHRNLVKIITLCCSVDVTGNEFKALVFKYMHHGNLEMWLHPEVHNEQGQRKILSLSQRVNIALDVAFALDYLHNQCEYPLIHCDLKPSNVLLDLDMTACIGDFGLARFLCTRTNEHSNTSARLHRLKGSIGYIAPEYGMSAEISTGGDVYSFGVLLLEMITGCRPTDEKFSSGTTLHESVYNAFPNDTYEILDPVLLQDESNASDVMRNCIIQLVRVGLSCSMTSPKARWEMGKVCTEILAIKDTFSSIHGV